MRIDGRHQPLHVLVRGEIRRGAWPVAGQRHGAAAEDTFDAALGVELAHDVEAAGVAGLFAGGEGFLALDLEEDFDALEGSGDEGHGDGGEEAGGGELGDGEGGGVGGGGGGGGGGEGGDEVFADAVALRWVGEMGGKARGVGRAYPERDGDCGDEEG